MNAINFGNYSLYSLIVIMMSVVFVFSLFFTNALRKFAISKNIIDIPNERSAHITPKPRGGGIAFVGGFLLLLPVLVFLNWVNTETVYSLLISGLLISSTGFYDDYKTISVKTRMFVHVLGAFIVLYLMHGMPNFMILNWQIPTGFVVNVLGVFYLTWLVNLYNFMDGIDAIASVEALSVCIGMSVIYFLTNNEILAILPLLLAAAVAGFLYWNRPPAKIFMGDVGSCFLGLCFGVLSIQATSVDKNFFWSWIILLGVFIIDTSFTLCFRLIKGEQVFKPHCSHSYQKVARKLDSHILVTLLVLIINILWLYPWAILVGKGHLDGFIGLLIAYIPLFILVFIIQIKLS